LVMYKIILPLTKDIITQNVWLIGSLIYKGMEISLFKVTQILVKALKKESSQSIGIKPFEQLEKITENIQSLTTSSQKVIQGIFNVILLLLLLVLLIPSIILIVTILSSLK
ncbi:MAG: hypothetical protein MJB14_01840, partial [Spirochaetes bacterium]|nr:hypothetical protein [Spirochaetota bacterium]